LLSSPSDRMRTNTETKTEDEGQKDELLLRPRYAVLCEVRFERYKKMKVRQGCYRHQASA